MTDTPNSARDPREIEWPLEHSLSKPITVGQDTMQVFVLREPTGEDVVKFGLLEGLSADQFFPLVSALTALAPSVIKKAPASDIIRLGTILSRFFAWAALPPAPSTTVSE
ncbi:phage tail assembly protein [Methylobacterium brachiatum]|uniref:phage tail assembly protein n=1 Tax=Methylobacterium brachiatum TaxID=269660 RepID=UPI0024498921|nr:phage tail assembly protein [Methylobacterium brachiatum]MDH2313149.1 phage tail assembly protein [Methylobacterium brachiatum]